MDDTVNDSQEYRNARRAAKQLAVLILYRGRDRVCEMLNIDAPTLDGLLSCTMDWPSEAWRRFQDALDNLSAAGYPIEVDDEVVLEDGDAEGPGTDPGGGTEAACDDDTDLTGELDGVAQSVLEPAVNTRHDEELEGEGVAAVDGCGLDEGPGEMELEEDAARRRERELGLLWQVRDLTVAHCLRRGVPYRVQLAGLRVVMMTEAFIIGLYGEVPTEPGVRCDANRQYEESERRKEFDARVRQELDAVHGGIKGFLDRFVGKGPVNVRRLERRMFAEAREMGPGYHPRQLFDLIDHGDFAHAPPLVKEYFMWHRPQA